MEAHNKRLAKIVAKISEPGDHSKRIRIYHGSSNSTRIPDFTNFKTIDTSSLDHILEINTKDMYVLVEPSVQLDQLVEATLKHGLLPPVVMEFPGISVGGGIQGGAGESSSFKYGGFHETAIEYEMVLGDGSVVLVSRQVNKDLFWGSACSYGSLGVITLVKLKLIAASPFVKLTYKHTHSRDQALQLIDDHMGKMTVDFIDGILFSPISGVIMTGEFAEKAEGQVATFTNTNDDWFYMHAKKIIRKHENYNEYIPIRDYLFRYDRAAFWSGEIAIKFWKLPFTKLTRSLMDKQLHTRFLYRVLQTTDISQRIFIQDIFMPKEKINSFIDYIEDKLKIWPLWLLPIQSSREKLDIFGLSFPGSKYTMDVGIWGKINTKSYTEFEKINRDVETELPKFNAHKVLYAHSYYPKNEFWKIYDHKQYVKLRQKYHAEGIFDDIYDKVTVKKAYDAPIVKALKRYAVNRLRS
jgi:delta24-sterol reductase